MCGSKSNIPTTHHSWCCLVLKLLHNGVKVEEIMLIISAFFMEIYPDSLEKCYTRGTTWSNIPCIIGWHRPGPPPCNQRCAKVPTFKNGSGNLPS